MDMMTNMTTPLRRCARRRTLYALMLLGLLAGTSGGQSPSSRVPDVKDMNLEAVKLRPGLVISMSVLVAGKKEIDEPAKRISDKGTVVLPLLGEVAVADMSLDDFQAQLTARYVKYFIEPQVIVDFVRNTEAEGISPWGFVTVLGQVQKPGRVAVPATRDMTVSGAIQKAGGFAPSAKAGAILVTQSLPDGRTITRTVNLHAVGAAGRREEDVILNANDVVFVPESIF